MEYNEEFWSTMYYKMCLARFFEEKILWMLAHGLIHGSVHLAMGQEASGVAACMALDPGDFVSSTHRCHAHAIGKGMDINAMMAEIMSKANGCCKGKGGSMHLCDWSLGFMGGNGAVSGGFPLSCGVALTQKLKKTENIVMCIGGDGSTNEGNFHEALNLASVWKLPVLFYIENNYYGISTPVEKSMHVAAIANRAAAYDIPGVTVDGNNGVEVHEAVRKAAEYVREGNGPMLLVADTYRYNGHSKSDPQVYRSGEEVNAWKGYDPINNLFSYLTKHQMAERDILMELKIKARDDVDAAYRYAKSGPEPQIQSVVDDLYA